MKPPWLRARSALDLALPALLALCVIRFWLMPLGASWCRKAASIL